MHLAGMLDLHALLRAVWTRALLMNETEGAQRGAMLAVIGLKESLVVDACASVSTPADPVQIANFNCPGQYTLAGSRAAVEAVRPLLVNAKAHKIVDVPVQGAWHSPLMAAAVPRFHAFLTDVELAAPRVPVLGNLTGNPLPTDAGALRTELARHLTMPVQWNGVIQHLLANKIGRFVEAGFGNTLTKFGMFIDRSVSHVTWGQAIKAKT
jgi:[acyl-carrier-protein] S-malonyltransferase